MGNHEFCTECGVSDFHRGRDCDPAQKSEYQKELTFAQKDKQFAEQVQSGLWPSDTCKQCESVGHCHLDYSHHLYDCCTHCGNDERNARKHSYRGK